MGFYRQRMETVAGCFSTLLVLLPCRRLEPYLGSESAAVWATAGVLLAVSVLAYALSRSHWARGKSYRVKIYDERFHLSGFLRDFAFFAWAELGVGLIAWCTYLYVDGPGSRD